MKYKRKKLPFYLLLRRVPEHHRTELAPPCCGLPAKGTLALSHKYCQCSVYHFPICHVGWSGRSRPGTVVSSSPQCEDRICTIKMKKGFYNPWKVVFSDWSYCRSECWIGPFTGSHSGCSRSNKCSNVSDTRTGLWQWTWRTHTFMSLSFLGTDHFFSLPSKVEHISKGRPFRAVPVSLRR